MDELGRALRLSDSFGVFLLVSLQGEVVEQLAAGKELLLLDELERSLGEQHGREPGSSLVELRACLQMLIRVGSEQAVEQQAMDARARRDRRIGEADHAVLEQRREEILQERAEMWQKHRALLGQAAESARVAQELPEAGAIVGVGLDPVGAARDRGRRRGRGGGSLTAAGAQWWNSFFV